MIFSKFKCAHFKTGVKCAHDPLTYGKVGKDMARHEDSERRVFWKFLEGFPEG